VVDKPLDSGITILLKSYNQQDPSGVGKFLSLKVQASDLIGQALQSVTQSLESECLFVYKGHSLDPEKRFHEYKIGSNDKIMLVHG
jgi:hypothetical protein